MKCAYLCFKYNKASILKRNDIVYKERDRMNQRAGWGQFTSNLVNTVLPNLNDYNKNLALGTDAAVLRAPKSPN